MSGWNGFFNWKHKLIQNSSGAAAIAKEQEQYNIELQEQKVIKETAKKIKDAYEDFAMRFCVRRSQDAHYTEVVEHSTNDAILNQPINVWKFPYWQNAKLFHDNMMWEHIAKALIGKDRN